MKKFLIEKFPQVPLAVKVLILSMSALLIVLLLVSFLLSRDTSKDIISDDDVSNTSSPQAVSRSTSSPSSTPLPTITPSPTPTIPANCFEINQNVSDALNLGIDGLTVKKAFGYVDPQRDNFYFVVAELAGANIQPGDIQGVWATSDDRSTEEYDGILLSVDVTAIAFSVLPDGSVTEAEFSTDEAAVTKSLTCLNN
jgi:hypothetical protein